MANREVPVAEVQIEKKAEKIVSNDFKQGIKRKGSQKKSEMKSYQPSKIGGDSSVTTTQGAKKEENPSNGEP